MAKKKETVTEQVAEEPKVDDKVEKIKVKKKSTMKKLNQDDEVVKVDLTKPKENADTEQETADVASDNKPKLFKKWLKKYHKNKLPFKMKNSQLLKK